MRYYSDDYDNNGHLNNNNDSTNNDDDNDNCDNIYKSNNTLYIAFTITKSNLIKDKN